MKTIRLITLAISLIFLPTIVRASNLGDIITLAGGGVGDNSIATSACIYRPTGVTVDSSGNLYIADQFHNRIRKVDSGTGIISTVAGNGVYGYRGDNGPATSASLAWPSYVVVDSSGNLFIADQDNKRIRKVAYGTGIITTVASVNSPAGITVDSSGNLYIADGSNSRILKMDRGTGIITTVAGNGTQGFSGDNGIATAASITPAGVAVDNSGNLYIADYLNNRIRKVDSGTGIITTVAGNGTQGFSGDNGPATAASLYHPSGVTADSSGNLYLGDLSNSRIRKVAIGTGIITTVAGNGMEGYSGDNGAATAASFDCPRDVTVDSSGNLYIADYINNRIRKVDSGTGIITTVAGNGTEAYAGDNGPATSARFDNLRGGVTVDSAGNFYVADYNNNRIRKVASRTGIITTVAGNGFAAFSGDNGPATSASLQNPSRVAIDSSGNLFIADTTNHRIRKVAIGTGIITTVAGNSSIPGFGGDNGPATLARLYWPSGVTFDSSGNLYIADYGNHRIRKVDNRTGIITTVAGNGTAGFSGDGGAASAASLYRPSEVIIDSSGNLYFAEYYNQRIRKVVNGSGIIITVAGNGTQGFSGDNVAATSASLNNPWGVAIDSSGNLYIADEWNHRIRKVDSWTGIITTVAGNGSYGFSGDNGPATSANVYDPTGVTVDSSGNLYITEWGSGRIRKVYLNKVPTVTALISSVVDNNSVSGSAVTFTATVTSTESIPNNTSVTFKDGGATIGSGVLDATGKATFTTSSLTPGSHNITASYPDTGILAGSTSPILVQTVAMPPQLAQNITGFNPPATATYGDASIILSAAATSGLPVAFAATGPGSISGNVLTITGAGDIMVTASQAGNTNYTAAQDVQQTIFVAKAKQSITGFNPLATATYGDAPITLSATATSGLPVTFAATGPGRISGNLLTLTGVGDIAVTAIQAGNTNYTAAGSVQKTITVGYSTSSPTLIVSTLPNGSTTNNATLNISGTAGAINGIKSVTVNATVVTLASDGSFSHATTLQLGTNTITTVATDNAGKTVTDTRTITLDTTSPVINITAPADNSTLAVSSVTVTGSVDKSATVQAKVNSGSSETAARDGAVFSVTLNLAEGTNTIVITATDLAANTSLVKRTIISDTTKPTLIISDPVQDISTSQATMTIRGTVSDAVTEVSVAIACDGQNYTPVVVNGAFQQEITFTKEKQYAIVVTATDYAGNGVTAQRNVIYAPSVAPIGDMDGDGKVGIADALLALRVAVGLITPTADLAVGDVAPLGSDGKPAGDGRIDAADALLILRKTVGLVNW